MGRQQKDTVGWPQWKEVAQGADWFGLVYSYATRVPFGP
jgi:hypothetical protein